jgi:phosphatidylinositol alpha-1,6-mannosyltransferase
VSAAPRILAMLTDAWGAGGGIAQFNRDWVDAVCAAGAKVDVLAYGMAEQAAGPQQPGVGVIGARLGRLAFARRALDAASARPDLVFCGHLHLAPVAAWVARRAGCRWWLQLHGIEAWHRPGRLRRAAAGRADLLVAVSRCTRARALAWWDGEPWRARVLPNTVDAAFAPGPRDAALAARLGIDGGPVLLTVGRLAAAEAYKGHDRVLRALPSLLARWPGLQYVVAGDGDDRPRLEAVARELGVDGRVRLAGAVPRAELPGLYRLADAFAMPSTGEGFGIAFLEAMACGVPALGLEGDGSVDALGDGEFGLVVSQPELEAGLVRLLEGAAPQGPSLAGAVQRRFGGAMFQRQVAALLAGLATVRPDAEAA